MPGYVKMKFFEDKAFHNFIYNLYLAIYLKYQRLKATNTIKNYV